MAHQHHHHLQDSAAIFSPSVARQAASAARNWSYVDSWLSSKFPHGSPLPPFERNQDTLKALLALASANEAADEERELLARAEADAFRELASYAAASHAGNDDDGGLRVGDFREGLLAAVEDELTDEGRTSLDAMAALAVQVGAAYPDPEDLGRRIVALRGDLCEAEQARSRVDILQSHIEREIAQASDQLARLQSDHYRPAPDLAKQNLEMQRKVKAASAQLPELQNRLAALTASTESTTHPTVGDVTREEEEYLAVLARKKELDACMAAFEGLPSDPDQARSELESLRRQLNGATSRRDEVFEGLVERESPVKRR